MGFKGCGKARRVHFRYCDKSVQLAACHNHVAKHKSRQMARGVTRFQEITVY